MENIKTCQNTSYYNENTHYSTLGYTHRTYRVNAQSITLNNPSKPCSCLTGAYWYSQGVS